MGTVSVATSQLLQEAITTSKTAFRGWANTPAAQRRDIISESGKGSPAHFIDLSWAG